MFDCELDYVLGYARYDIGSIAWGNEENLDLSQVILFTDEHDTIAKEVQCMH